MHGHSSLKVATRAGAVLWPLALVFVLSCALATNSDDWEKEWNERQPPGEVMDAVGIVEGMVVAEIGAGRGRYAVQVASRVGPKGKVYAEDIDEDALDYVSFRCTRDGIDNIETILGEVADPKLPPGSCDFIYCINTYHHIDKPVPLLRNTISALKPTGRLVIIEHLPETARKHGFIGHSTPVDTVMAHAKAAGFDFVEQHSFLEFDEIYVFQVGVTAPSTRESDT
ncbi:MAG: methyltransferase domain-containing protein [bacterium]